VSDGDADLRSAVCSFIVNFRCVCVCGRVYACVCMCVCVCE